jgi:hypothetical protein
LERLGVPTVTICTNRFESFAREKALSLKAARLPIVSIPHPISGRREEEVAAMASEVLPKVVEAFLTLPEPGDFDVEMITAPPSFSDTIELEDDIDTIYDFFCRQGWTDGLPIIPPTPERITQILKQYNGDPSDVLGKIPHLNGEATIERCAIAMVMAGCLPVYLPVVLAAVRAMQVPAFNIQAVQSTTNAIAPLLILNGPVISRLGFNCKENVFGQGNRANATVGRSIRFILLNVGGADPGKLDRATHGHPGKYSYCVAENEDESPWEPFHVDRGFKREDSVVTVVGADAPMNINDASSTSAEGVLHSIASAMITPGSNNALRGGEPLVVFSPEHADLIARDGWSKADVRAYLYEHSQIPLYKFSPENRKRILLLRKKWFEREGDKDKVALADSPEAIMLLVTGGPGKHSLLITNFGNTAHASQRIDFAQTCDC